MPCRLSRLARTLHSRLILCAALCLIVSIAPAAAEKRVALVIGNAAYGSLPRLDTPARDAELMADTLRALGFALVGGRAQTDLDKAGFDTALKDFGARLAGADAALFYYAGHGIQLRGASAMIPVDAAAAKEAESALIDVTRVFWLMQAAGTKFNLVILDASRPNPLVRALHTEAGLAPLQPPARTLVASAALPGHLAREGSDGNSLFTRLLARQMLRPTLDVFQAFHEVDLAVKQATGGRQDNRQEVFVASAPIDGSFHFVPPPTTTTTPPPSPSQPRVVFPPLPPSPPPVAPSGVFPAPVVPAPAMAAVIPPNVGKSPAPAAVASTSGAVLYDEDPSLPQGHRYDGTVTWRTEPLADGSGIAVRAVVDVPERGLTMTLLLRRNADPALPASHTADIRFTLPRDVGGGGVENVPGVLMKLKETTRGTPLAGMAVKVAQNVFLVGLSKQPADLARNLDLLQSREWIDIPIVYANQRRAILAIAKGPDGERAFTQAFAAWSQAQPAAATSAPQPELTAH